MLLLRSESEPGEARLAVLWRAYTETIGDAPQQKVMPLETCIKTCKSECAGIGSACRLALMGMTDLKTMYWV